MGSTSFLGFSYSNLLLVFMNLLFFRNLYSLIFWLQVLGVSLGLFILFYRYFSVPYFVACDYVNAYFRSVLRKFCRSKLFDGKKKNTHLLRTGNSTTEPKKRKDISCYMLEIVQLMPILKKTAATYWKQ